MVPEPVLNHLFEFLDDLVIPWIHPSNHTLSYRFHPTYLQIPTLPLWNLTFFYALLRVPSNQTFLTYKLPLSPNHRSIAYEYSVPSTDANPSTFVWSTKTVIGPVDEFPQHTLQGGMVYNQGTGYPIYRIHMFDPSYEHVLVVEPWFARLWPLPHHVIHALYPTDMETAYFFAHTKS